MGTVGTRTPALTGDRAAASLADNAYQQQATTDGITYARRVLALDNWHEEPTVCSRACWL
ncbi:MAG: hypothetical protein IPJ94_16740 [Chloroflexi bacterium]|nr:hypothetical protein [Chloroflexota bacterium]